MIIDFRVGTPFPAAQPGRPTRTLYGEVYGRSRSRAHGERRGGSGHMSAEEMLALLDQEGIDRAVLPAEDHEVMLGRRTGNEELAEFCSTDPDRLIGFAGADPLKGMDGVRDLEHAVRDLGLRGLNIGSFWSRLDPTDARYYPLYAKCVELDVPVILHAANNFSLETVMDHSHPRHIDRVATDFPELKIISTHGGWPWGAELVAVAWRHEHVYIDTASQRPLYMALPNTGWGPLVHFGNNVLQDKVLFASRWPELPFRQTIEEIRQLPLKPAVLEKWLGGNAARLLGFDG
jgi:predicted TIM-barrel fold metal-dependent hydrolase